MIAGLLFCNARQPGIRRVNRGKAFDYTHADGRVVDIGSADVNGYLQEITGRDFTSKDFRTWAGTVLAATLLRECEDAGSESHAKKNIVRAVEQVAKRLGNTKAVCRKCYIHPAIFDAYLDGTIRAARAVKTIGRVTAAEAAVLGLLQRRLAKAG
jgi:DNA topoisomerase-1